ncbi:hypothetical protein [uncultured Rhodoblastus sp.]|uniref:hypothetical protein n=1 Tax=uncultured Rhodoblastus sp. TaxID=543037 RepID=UPI0025D19C63|nr:hypothetical protein [uncultured Rhodoblastus sp.]
MKRFVVDTNVAIVANGQCESSDDKPPAIECRVAAVNFLIDVIKSARIILDMDGEVQIEYHRYLNPRGQPGVGDRFYLEVINSLPDKVERVALSKRSDGEYVDLPQPLIDISFDPSDRKFAAIAKLTGTPVVNATDSDWVNAASTLKACGIEVENLCGCDKSKWFEE